MQIRVPWLMAVVLISGLALAQQSAQQPVVVNPEGAKFVTAPTLPDCFNFALKRGDPKGSGSVMLVEMKSGCTVPTHWHSANEQATFIKGAGQIEMNGEQPQAVSAGTYLYIPAHHAHQLTCKDGCSFYRFIDGPADIHYVDPAGNEISVDAALAGAGEHPGTAVAQK